MENTKIRVLLVLNDGNRGGIAKVVQPLLENQGNCEFRVICGSEGAFVEDLQKMQVSVGVIDLHKDLFDYMPVRELRREIRYFQAQVVHSHHSRAYLRGRVAAWLEGVPHISTPHNPVLDELDCRPDASRFRRSLFLLREWLSAGLDDYTIALSSHNKERLLKQGIRGNRVRIISNGVDLNKFSPGNSDDNLRSSLSFGMGDKIIGLVGRLVQQKGIDDLIKAFAQLPEMLNGSICKLLIVGDGPDRRDLEQLAVNLGVDGRVRFLGQRDNIPDLLGIMDIVVFPSRYEGLPIALLEAMAMERPIVAVDLPVFSSVLCNGSGMLVPREKLHEGIIKLACDTVLSSKLSIMGRQLVREIYDQEKISAETFTLYKQAVCPLASS